MYFCNYLLEKYILLSNNYISYNFINKIRKYGACFVLLNNI